MRATRTKLPPIDLNLAPGGRITRRHVKATEAKHLNKLVARCAEDLVFSSTESSGIASLVSNAARFRVELGFVEFPAPEPHAVYQGSIIRVRESR